MSDVQAVIGLQWGDEGKGKIVDMLGEKADLVARYQGGANAGHTVVTGDDKVVLHEIPSGILRHNPVCVLGQGVVVDPANLIEEMENLRALDIPLEDRLLISPNCHVVLPYHKVLDGAFDQLRGKEAIGTTGRGIGPSHADKVSYWGIQMKDLQDPETFRSRLQLNYRWKKPLLEDVFETSLPPLNDVFKTFTSYGEKLADFITPVRPQLKKAINDGKTVLMEGAQGTMLDVDYGTYPYVTGSNASRAGIAPGTGLGVHSVDQVIGVLKTYVTRVGKGPLPTELDGQKGKELREKGNEFGSTTGRPRRCGWLDIPATRYANEVNETGKLALMKLDILSGFEQVNICTGYQLDGNECAEFPVETDRLYDVEPIYETHRGWSEDIQSCRSFSDLPEQARSFVQRIEGLLSRPVTYIGVGPGREEVIVRHEKGGNG